MIGKSFRVLDDQAGVHRSRQTAPMLRFFDAAQILQYPRELRGIVRILRRHRQGIQTSHGILSVADFCLDLRKMTLRRRAGGKSLYSELEQLSCFFPVALMHPHLTELEIEQGKRERRHAA